MFSKQGIDAIGKNDRFSFQYITVGFHTHNFAVFEHQFIDTNTRDALRPGVFRLLHQPCVKFAA
ncbi:hypothetical protein D3C75_1380910 [compost metagenome]